MREKGLKRRIIMIVMNEYLKNNKETVENIYIKIGNTNN